MYNTQGKLSSASKNDLEYSDNTCNSNVLNNVYSTYDRSIYLLLIPILIT